MDFESIPADVVALCARLQQAGHRAYVVGGSVRDLLLGRPVTDWDVTTSARPEQVQALFRKTIPTGVKHGTVTVVTRGRLPVEVTTFRGEGAYSDGRHPDQVEFVDDLRLDLERRDFTINAIALDPLTGTVHDPLCGRCDLERGVVRAVGAAGKRFHEDGLRSLRAVRFAAVLQFRLEDETFAAIPAALGTFRRVSSERVREELFKLLLAPRPSRGVELLRRSGLLSEVLPELASCIGREPGGQDDRSAEDTSQVFDLYQRSLGSCDLVPAQPLLRLAALLHEVGWVGLDAAATEQDHARAGGRVCREIADRLRLSHGQREELSHWISHHAIDDTIRCDAEIRRLIQPIGVGSMGPILQLRRADLAARREAGSAPAIRGSHAAHRGCAGQSACLGGGRPGDQRAGPDTAPGKEAGAVARRSPARVVAT